MSTTIRAEISKKNKYWIEKHRYYELRHFCLQYPHWKRMYISLENASTYSSKIDSLPTDNTPGDPTAKTAISKVYYLERIRLIENTARDTDEDLYIYILKAVTEGLSYTYLKSRLEIPCSRDMYYDRYRKFFWLLNRARD